MSVSAGVLRAAGRRPSPAVCRRIHSGTRRLPADRQSGRANRRRRRVLPRNRGVADRGALQHRTSIATADAERGGHRRGQQSARARLAANAMPPTHNRPSLEPPCGVLPGLVLSGSRERVPGRDRGLHARSAGAEIACGRFSGWPSSGTRCAGARSSRNCARILAACEMSGSLMLIFAAAPNLAMMGSSDSVASAGASSVSV